MFKKLVILIIFMLLVTSSFPIIFGNTANISNEIIVPDDYPSIQIAIDNANNGDKIFVRNGTYYENIIIGKSIILKGENRETTIIDANGMGNVIVLTADYTTISGFTITNSGFVLPPPPSYFGILVESSYNNISNNIISNNMNGIVCESSSYNTLINNSLINDGISINGYYSSNYIHTIYNNTVNGKPYYYFYNKNNFTVHSDAGSVFLFRCSNVMISGLNIDSTENGIKLAECNKCTIQNSNISNVDAIGIMIDTSNGIIIQDNQIINALSYGILLTGCFYDEIRDNVISGDTWVGIAFAHFCQYNNLTGNLIDIESSHTILEHPNTGIWFHTYCYNNNIIDNVIRDCQIGLWMGRSHLNIIKTNLFENCHIGTSPNKIDSYKEFNIFDYKVNPVPLTARGAGIYLIETGENDITFNTISNNDVGIISYRSWFDNIQFNNIMDSTTGFDFITLLSLGYYPFNYWGASITGPIFKCNKLFCLIPWSPIRISEAP